MAAIIVTKPEDGLISFSSEKNDGDVWEAHRLPMFGAPKTNKDENTGPSWVGAKNPLAETARLQGDF